MNVLEAIKDRRSVRTYTNKPVPLKTLQTLLEAAQWAPSAGNMQARDFIIVMDSTIKIQLSEAALNQWFIAEAPVNIVVCANLKRSASRYGERGISLYAFLDAAAAVENIILTAHALGLATCWIGAYRDEEVMSILELPEWDRPIAIIPIGFPGEHPSPPHRIGVEKITFLDKYGHKWHINE